jgi:hypothetical protein
MSSEIGSRVRFGEAFWRAHHEAWQQSALNQREYCEAHGIPLKAFGNWRAKFKARAAATDRKLLYRRRGLSHTLSHSVSHMTYGCAEPIVPPAREGHRRKFSEPFAWLRDILQRMTDGHPASRLDELLSNGRLLDGSGTASSSFVLVSANRAPRAHLARLRSFDPQDKEAASATRPGTTLSSPLHLPVSVSIIAAFHVPGEPAARRP